MLMDSWTFKPETRMITLRIVPLSKPERNPEQLQLSWESGKLTFM